MVKAFCQAEVKPNFIFIVVDDLNDYVEGFTDNPQILTPNIKSLANSGTIFINNYASSPGCAPSRTSFFSGKDIKYIQVYNNEDYKAVFRENFSAEKNNEVVFTIPEILKDSGNYFTYGINKLFHNPASNDYDKSGGTPTCEKSLSWNAMSFFEDTEATKNILEKYSFGNYFDWGMIPDSLEILLEDYRAADTAIAFINAAGTGTANTCDKPFFLGVGFNKPHAERFIPEQYFPPFYVNDLYQDNFQINYNNPPNQYPYNGILMPNQPEPIYSDYYNLPADGIAMDMADNGNVFAQIEDYVSTLDPLPSIDEILTTGDVQSVLQQTVAANYQVNYIAAVQYIDAQVGRILDALNNYPELKNNTIIILLSDNGYSLGEKRHWTKWTLWEPDIRVPLIISTPEITGGAIVNQPVSLLDLFPTICDLAGISYPTFPDGRNYLDGKSLQTLLEQPSVNYESSVLVSYKKNQFTGSCFPLHTIINNGWRYILYRENNDGSTTQNICDANNFSYEKELYELGMNRETDPNEWNNLAYNKNYAPLINYLNQWLPDSALYLNKTNKVVINQVNPGCFINSTDTISLFFEMYDTLGLPISPPDEYIYKWSNNFNTAISYGTVLSYPAEQIAKDNFEENRNIIFYLEVLSDDNDIINGFDLIDVQLSEADSTFSSFNVANLSDLTVLVKDLSFTGSYNKTWWDFGDGFISYDKNPAAHQYNVVGNYLITNYVQFGNNNCITKTQKMISAASENTTPELPLKCFPNPASNQLFVTVPNVIDYAAINIFDLSGKLVFSNRFIGGDYPFSTKIDISNYNAGLYIINFQSDTLNYSSKFVIAN